MRIQYTINILAISYLKVCCCDIEIAFSFYYKPILLLAKHLYIQKLLENDRLNRIEFRGTIPRYQQIFKEQIFLSVYVFLSNINSLSRFVKYTNVQVIFISADF